MSLHIPGFIFDAIQGISKGPERPEREHCDWKFHWPSWLWLAQSNFQPFISSRKEQGAYTRAILRTFTTYNRFWDDPELAILRPSSLVYWEDGPEEVFDAMENSFRMLRDRYDMGKTGTLSQDAMKDEEVQRLILLAVTITEKERRAKFFVTRNHRMGLAPMGAAVGDRIAIMASGEVPFVLRPVPVEYAGEEAYRIIGGCYLDGAMDGEVVYQEAARLCKEQKGKLSARTIFESSRLAPLSNAARERSRGAAVELAFADCLCLV